jgi:cobaltochelatase CobS
VPPKEEGGKEEKPEEKATPEAPNLEKVIENMDLDKLADLLVQKVQEKLKPFELPPLHHKVLPDIIKAVQADVPVWLQGPPGTSKSTIGRQVADTLGLAFHAISCHEAMTRSDMFGYTDAHGTDHRSPLWDAYELGGVLLLDEIDNGNANILAALNSALSNGFCTFAGKTVNKHENFRVIAAANTAGLGPESGFIGRMGVDLATLDRFATIQVPIDENLETGIVKAILPDGYAALLKTVRKLRKLVQERGLRTVVSPRCSINSARQMKHGVSMRDALIRTGCKGLDDTTLNSLLSEVGL